MGGNKKERKLEVEAAEKRIKAFYEYRQGYINNIIQCAAQNPKISFWLNCIRQNLRDILGGQSISFIICLISIRTFIYLTKQFR